MTTRKRALVGLASLDLMLAIFVLLVWMRLGEAREAVGKLTENHQQLAKLAGQMAGFRAAFETRFPVPTRKDPREVKGELYDLVDREILQPASDLLVRGVEYDTRRGTDFDGLVVRIPVEPSPFGAVQRFLDLVEKLQERHWLAVDELNLESRLTPRRGIGGQATLVLYRTRSKE